MAAFVLIMCTAALASYLYLYPIPTGTLPPRLEQFVDQAVVVIGEYTRRPRGAT